MYYQLTDAEIRNICKEKLESLEHWLRRMIDDILGSAYGDYFSYKDAAGASLIKSSFITALQKRKENEPGRYPRLIDAVLLDDAVDIITNPELYRKHFGEVLKEAFPDGREEARTFLTRLITARNPLAHANPISIRKAEQVICYSGDVIDSIKSYYTSKNMDSEYNVPLILKVTDSFGNVFHRTQLHTVHDGGIGYNFSTEATHYLRVGDTLTLEIEVDPSFDDADYSIKWGSGKGLSADRIDSKKIVIQITEQQVAQSFHIQCWITSNKSWHRMEAGCDDFLMLQYKVLPPKS